VDTEDAVVNDGCQGKIVKDIGTVAPYVQRPIFPEAFVIETVDLSDLPTFVVSSY